MNSKLFKYNKRDVVQYILVLTVISIILAYAFPKIRDKMGVAHKNTVSNLDFGMGNMFSNSQQPGESPPPPCTPITLPTVSHDVPLNMRQPFINSYTYEYAITVSIARYNPDGGGYPHTSERTYIYSNTPLSLSVERIYNDSTPVTDGYGSYDSYRVKEANNRTYAGFQGWEIGYDDWWSGYFNGYGTYTSFTNGTLNHLYVDSSITSITDISGQSQNCGS